jgi:hypothetical protein
MDAKTDLHPVVADRNEFKNSGEDTSKVNAPIVSVAPASGETSKDSKHFIVENVLDDLFDEKLHNKTDFDKLEVGQGVFIPVEQNKTTDDLLANINRKIIMLREQYSEVERNIDGDEIHDQVIVLTRKRNPDGTIQLENDKPIVGANAEHMPRRIYYRNFVAKPIVKGDKLGDKEAEGDGVLVIRAI